MSIPVALSDLADTLARFRFAYLLTSAGAGAPRVVAVMPQLQGGELLVEAPGRSTCGNVLQRPEVCLVWPPQDASAPSLIVDGQAAVVGEAVRITPLRAVLHRPAQRSESAPGCAAPGAPQA